MSGDESIFSSLRKRITGPTVVERAEALKEKAIEEPESIDEGEIDVLIAFLSEDDQSVVTNTLHALSSVAIDQPELVSKATPTIIADLENRPGSEWSETPLREMSDKFMQDLTRGEILLHLAEDDADYLDPVVEDLVEKYKKPESLEPTSFLALAHVVADQSDRTELSRDPFVDWVTSELTHIVTNEKDEFGIQLADTTLFVNLLGKLGGDKALETLKQIKDKSDDDEVSRTVDRAIEKLKN